MKRIAHMMAAAILSAAAAQAAPQLFTVNIPTGSLTGTAYLDFNFASASDAADAGTLSILGFSSDATLGLPTVFQGTVTGNLPGAVVLENLPSPGAYYSQELTLGTYISFKLLLDGPLVNAPTGGGDGSTFAVWLYDDALNPLLSADSLLQVDINGEGEVSLTSLSTAIQVTGPTPVPEPGTYTLLAAGLAGIIALKRRSA